MNPFYEILTMISSIAELDGAHTNIFLTPELSSIDIIPVIQ
jgi:hypothetical protein